MSKNTSKNMAALITAILMLTTASGCSSSKGSSDDVSTTAESSSVVSSTEAETSTSAQTETSAATAQTEASTETSTEDDSNKPKYICDGRINTRSTGLDLRAKPDSSSEILTEIPNGTVVPLYSHGIQGWMYTEYGGKSGYVSDAYVEFLSAGGGNSGGGNTSVPSYSPTAEQQKYIPLYDALVEGSLFETGGYLGDFNNDGLCDMILNDGEYFSIYINDGSTTDVEVFGVISNVLDYPLYTVQGSDGRTFICGKSDDDEERLSFYYNYYNDTFIIANIRYTSTPSGNYRAGWEVSKNEIFPDYSGYDSVANIGDEPEKYKSALSEIFAQYNFSITEGSQLTPLRYKSYNDLKAELLELTGRQSSLVGAGGSEGALSGEGYTTSTVKLYSSPQSSTPIDEIPANTKVNVIDDSISGWLLVSLWNNNHISYGYVAADSVSWDIVS